MDESALAGFEARAADAERRIAAVEARLAAGSPSAPVEIASSGTVEGLQQLRSLLVKAKAEQLKLEEQSAETKAENEALRKELQQATVKTAKLQYRVEHLKDAVRSGDTVLVAALEASEEQKQKMLEKYKPLLSVAHLPNGKAESRTASVS